MGKKVGYQLGEKNLILGGFSIFGHPILTRESDGEKLTMSLANYLWTVNSCVFRIDQSLNHTICLHNGIVVRK